MGTCLCYSSTIHIIYPERYVVLQEYGFSKLSTTYIPPNTNFATTVIFILQNTSTTHPWSVNPKIFCQFLSLPPHLWLFLFLAVISTAMSYKARIYNPPKSVHFFFITHIPRLTNSTAQIHQIFWNRPVNSGVKVNSPPFLIYVSHIIPGSMTTKLNELIYFNTSHPNLNLCLYFT